MSAMEKKKKLFKKCKEQITFIVVLKPDCSSRRKSVPHSQTEIQLMQLKEQT